MDTQIRDRWDDGGLKSLHGDEQLAIRRFPHFRALRNAPVGRWNPGAYGTFLGVPPERVTVARQVAAAYVGDWHDFLNRENLSIDAATAAAEAVAIEAVVEFDPKVGVPIEAFLAKRIGRALFRLDPAADAPDPLDRLAFQAFRGEPKATRMLYYILRRDLKNKKQWFIPGWTKREMVAELLLELFAAFNVLTSLEAAGGIVLPGDVMRVFWRRVRQRLGTLIRQANDERKAIVERADRDELPNLASDVAEPTPPNVLLEVLDAVKVRATDTQKAILLAIEARLADDQEAQVLFQAVGLERDIAIHPRHLAPYLNTSLTPKAISKAIRRIRLLVADELRQRGLASRIPRGWSPTAIQ